VIKIEGTHKVEFSFGNVYFQRNLRSKNLRIKIHPEKGVLVSIPGLCPESRALDFVKQKEEWIRKTLAKTSQVKNKTTLFNEDSVFSTRFHQLVIQQHARQVLRFEARHGKLLVCYPGTAQVDHPKIQEFIRQSILKTLHFEAREYLPKRTTELAQKTGLNYSGISLRNNKSRWGSCSGKNKISLNIHLMRLNNELIDYVILHELAHTKVKSHGKPFWQFLEGILPGAEKLDKRLNEYHLLYW
jgi:hypothetical protein